MPDRLSESQVRFAGDGYLVRASLIAPAEGRHPAIIVNPGAGGMSERDLDVGRRLARQGYLALVVDPYSSIPEEKLPKELNYGNLLPFFRNLNDRSYMISLNNALAWLNSLPNMETDRVGVTGFCAPWSILFACTNPKVKAAVGFYNVLRYREQSKADRAVQPVDRIPNLWAPLMCHYGDNDTATPQSYMDELKASAAKHEKNVEVFVYTGAGHGFVEPGGAYKEKDADLAWSRSIAFFDKHVKGS
jgi:carboxymethylenebutenolidase